jgi:Lrp/AsnC family transcriptional regulator, leucine-responsive regulatory protein
MVELDAIDHKLLDVLQRDGRMAVTELSKHVNLSATPCTLRMRKLEQSGVIQGYRAHISPAAIGMSLLVFVTVKLRATDEATLRGFNAAVKPVKQILECHMTGGGFDYLLKLRVKDMVEYRQILGGVLGELPMIEGTHSYFVMEEVKETTVMPIPQQKDTGQKK